MEDSMEATPSNFVSLPVRNVSNSLRSPTATRSRGSKLPVISQQSTTSKQSRIRILEAFKALVDLPVEAHRHERAEPEPHPPLIDDRAIGRDRTLALYAAEPASAGGWREPDLLAELLRV
jgi:hypothetical protein